MSFNTLPNNVKSNDLEEGEIFDSEINKQELDKLIDENKKKNIINSKDTKLSIENSLNHKEENEDEAEGFFHKMTSLSNENNLLKKKRKNSSIDSTGNIHLNSKEENSNQNFKRNSIINKPTFEDSRKNNDFTLKPQNDFKNKNYSKKSQQENLSKKKMICNFYVNGACNKGKECPFSHDAMQNKKTELCKYFLTNACVKGNECIYSHDIGSYPCKFFHAVGYCEKGENCRFSHVRLSEEEIKKFLEENEEFIIELKKTRGRTNMDDYFMKYLSEKKNIDIDIAESLSLPFNNNSQDQNNTNNNLNVYNNSGSNLNFPMSNKPNFQFNKNKINQNMNFPMAQTNPQMMQNYNRMIMNQRMLNKNFQPSMQMQMVNVNNQNMMQMNNQSGMNFQNNFRNTMMINQNNQNHMNNLNINNIQPSKIKFLIFSRKSKFEYF